LQKLANRGLRKRLTEAPFLGMPEGKNGDGFRAERRKIHRAASAPW